ncbi:zinc finger MYM-type protein 1-like, partial [Aphis craccivora]
MSKLPKINNFFSTIPAVVPSIADEPQALELNELIQSPEIQIDEKIVDHLNTGKIDLKSNSILCTITDNSNIPEHENNSKEENEKNVLNLTLTNPTDYAHFGEEVENSDIKRSIIAFGPCKPVIEFPKNNDGRKFSSNFYFVSARSGSKIPRSWLCYSTVLDRAYCESCWLFANRKSTSFKSEWINGINDWKHLSQSIQRHEISTQHLESTNMRIIWMKNRTIDKELEIQYSKEATFWRNILLRLIKIILSLTAGNTALREHRGKIGSLEKCSEGNFLRTVNLLAEFDPILNNLVSNPKHKIKKSCGFSIILDSTQDIKKVDQVSIIIRYVLVNYEIKKIEIKESFLGFFVLDKHHAVDYANLLRQTLLTFGLSINKCFGQGYDGAAVMSGQHSGVQTLIRSDFPNAVYVHCCSHNLNLVISDAAKSSSKVQTFFNIVQDVYNFFSVSAPRWALLALGKEVESKIQKKTLKKVCPTQWEARHDSVFALKERYFDLIKALTHILLTSHKSDEKNLGGSLKKKLESAEFVLILSFWERILRSLNVVSKTLQLINFNIEFAVIQLDSAIEDLTNLRANYNNIVEDAKNLCVLWKIPFNFNCKRDR